jgi:hypothetical protein
MNIYEALYPPAYRAIQDYVPTIHAIIKSVFALIYILNFIKILSSSNFLLQQPKAIVSEAQLTEFFKISRNSAKIRQVF